MSKRGSFWTPEEDAILMARYKSGERLSVLAADIGRTVDGIEDRYRRLSRGGGTAIKRQPPAPPKQLTRYEIAEAIVRHEGACMREAGVDNRRDLAIYYRQRFEVAGEPRTQTPLKITPSSYSDKWSCVGSPAAMSEGN